MQVIWAIGASMVILAGAQFLGQRACLMIGGAILVGHNLLDPIWPATSGVFDTGHPVVGGVARPDDNRDVDRSLS